MFDRGRVLVAAPHLDDEVLGCGGLLHRLGERADVAFLCGRAYAGVQTSESTGTALKYAADARDTLGYMEIRFGGFHDERLTIADAASFLSDTIKELKPGCVLIPSAMDLHQDHATTARAARIAARGLNVASYYVPSGSEEVISGSRSFTPNLFVKLSEEDVLAKQRAMFAYQDELRPYPHMRSSRGIELAANWFGVLSGFSPMAEPYMIEKGSW